MEINITVKAAIVMTIIGVLTYKLLEYFFG
jgi:hypothetical protein